MTKAALFQAAFVFSEACYSGNCKVKIRINELFLPGIIANATYVKSIIKTNYKFIVILLTM